jgi:hypothetical protein
VLRIRDILVRIRIRGSVPLTNGSGSCYFREWTSRRQQNIILFSLLFFEGTFSSFFKDKRHSHKTVGIKALLFLLGDRRIRIRTSD